MFNYYIKLTTYIRLHVVILYEKKKLKSIHGPNMTLLIPKTQDGDVLRSQTNG